MTVRSRLAFALTLALATLASGPALAVGGEAALGSAGEIYAARTGLYRDLFPGGRATDPANAVLAFDVVRPGDKGTERLLVTGTEGSEVESFPFVLFEEKSGSVYLLWESRRHGTWSSLYLVSLQGDQWSPAIELSGDPFSWKSVPQLAVTSDEFTTLGADGASVTHHRRVVHIVWWEESGRGERAAYSPVIFIDGAYLGWNPVYLLSNFDGSEVIEDAAPSPHLYRSPSLAEGTDGRSVLISFTNLDTGRLVSLRVRYLPQELSFLADETSSYVAAWGGGLGKSQLVSLADGARANIIGIGAKLSLRPWLVERIGEQARTVILDAGAADPAPTLRHVADIARANIIGIGASLLGNELRSLPEPARANIIGIGARTEDAPAAGVTKHLFEFGRVAAWPAPASGQGPTTVYLSGDGGRALVAWERADRVLYRESRGAAQWSTVYTLKLNAGLPLTQAHEILRSRVRGR